MKILLLPDYFKPEVFASSYLFENRNEAFADAGYDMIVYAASPTRGVDRHTPYSHRESLYDGHLKLYRFKMFGESKSTLQRMVRYLCCSAVQFFKALFLKHFDVILLGSTPPFQGAVGALLKIIRKKPFIFGIQDIFPDSLVGTGLAKKGGLLWKIGRLIENFTYRHADKIIVISEDFKRNIMAKGVPEEKIEVIYNWVDENAVKPVADEENPLFGEFGISREGFRVVYAGNLGNAQNIELIVDAAARLKDGSIGSSLAIQFIIFGTGGLEQEIKQRKEREGLDNLMILPLQPYERVSQVYSLGNVCIVACKPGLGGAAMPSKTWSIMSAGRAVLANFDEGELKEIIEGNASTGSAQAPCGVFTKAGDLDGFVDAIKRLSSQNELCAKMGLAGRQFILANLTKEVGTGKYVDVIKSVAKK